MTPMTNAVPQRPARALVVFSLVLCLPAIAFVLSHLILQRSKLPLPDWVAGVLTWTLGVTGMLATIATVGAVVVATVATILGGLSGKAKGMMWSAVAASLLALVYLSRVRP